MNHPKISKRFLRKCGFTTLVKMGEIFAPQQTLLRGSGYLATGYM